MLSTEVFPCTYMAWVLCEFTIHFFFFFQAEDGIRDLTVTGVQTCALPICEAGRIATVTGHSKYINGPAGLAHLHRLRALVDGVLVGIGTAVADDPQLTVRRVAGPSPARIVLDPRGRLPPDARVLTADGTRRIVV